MSRSGIAGKTELVLSSRNCGLSCYLVILKLFFLGGLYAHAVAADEVEQSSGIQEELAEGDLMWPPYVQGGLSVEIFSDHTFRASDPNDEVSDTFAEINLSLVTFFSSELYLETDFSLLPVDEPVPGEDRFFEGQGLALNTLAITYSRDLFWISAGKGPINFGIAQSAASGIWGGDIPSEQYAVEDRIGFAGTVNLDTNAAGNHSFELATFFLDTSELSRTWITRTGPNSLEDGGPGNTESLNSLALAVDGAGIPSLPKFRYHLAGMLQATDRLNDANGDPLPASEVDDEYRIAVAGEWSSIELSESVAVTPLVEYVRLWNARGYRGDTEDYLTAALGFYIGQWSATVAATGVRVDDDGIIDEGVQAEVSFGYLFRNGVNIEAGYRYQDMAGDSSHTIGMAFGYFLPFAF